MIYLIGRVDAMRKESKVMKQCSLMFKGLNNEREGVLHSLLKNGFMRSFIWFIVSILKSASFLVVVVYV